MNDSKPGSKILLLFRMMLRYWPYMLAGLVAMALFAIFSGVSITLMVPLFDYVFNPNKPEIEYHKSSEILAQMQQRLSSFMQEQGSIWQINSLGDLSPLWESLKELMLVSDSLALLYLLCAVIVVLMLLKNLSYFANRSFFVMLRGKTIRDLRSYMFRRYLNQSLEFYGHNQVGDAIVRMVNDVEIVSNQFIFALFNSIRDFSTVLVYMYIAIFLNTRLFVYSILVVPLLTFTLGYLGKKIKKYSRRIQEQISAMFSVVEEVLNSIRIVKAFRKEDDEFRAFEKINRRHLRQWQRSQIYAALNVPLSELNTTITGVVVVIIGGGMILNPEASFSLGDFTAFLFAIFSMLHPLKSITQLYTEVKKATVSMDRIALVLNQVSSIQDAPDAIAKPDFEQEIVFDKVSFYYQPGKYVIRDLSLTIPKGQKIAFVGASGGGKTTITNLINRMYDVKEGRILLDGTDIRKIKLDDLRSLFGVVTQDSVLFTKTVRENIAYGSRKPLSEAEIITAAQIAHADEFIQNLPDKYDQVLDIKGLNLSGGQRQRLCIARAIVGNPPILIFDEATSALDTESERKVQDAIDEATRNRTVLLVAHRLSTILKADKIVVLEGGRIAGIGSHEELLASCPRYQTLYNLQFNL
ncbi:MAG: ABC transporter ATP-binding protein [Candidatus Cloacimonadaceae bacterium]|jgi:subfamily B ATP-binding cassette protein MsbA|nr:ABC transporter ATP-binding protein [Candidatus Cloacimonadaceae bacterium]